MSVLKIIPELYRPRKSIEYLIVMSLRSRTCEPHQNLQIYQFIQAVIKCVLIYLWEAALLYNLEKLFGVFWNTRIRLIPPLGNMEVLSFKPKVELPIRRTDGKVLSIRRMDRQVLFFNPKVSLPIRRNIILLFMYHMNQYYVLIKTAFTDTRCLGLVPVLFSVPVYSILAVNHRHYSLSVPLIVCTLLFYKLFLLFRLSKSKMISVSERTYHNLAQMGTLEDTFDSVIDRMIQKQNAASGQSSFEGRIGQTAGSPKQSGDYNG